MAESIYTFALSTLQRIKDRMGITVTDNDAVLQRLLNVTTDFIEGECQRHFAEKTYTDELYSIWGERLEFIQLKQMHITVLTAVKYRAGTPSNPNWTVLGADFYELVENGESGLIRIYPGFAPLLYTTTNALSVTYTAGYKTDWANFGNMTTHTLPADLTDLCERLVIRWWKRRESGGKQSESLQNSSINWRKELDDEDIDTLQRYSRPNRFV